MKKKVIVPMSKVVSKDIELLVLRNSEDRTHDSLHAMMFGHIMKSELDTASCYVPYTKLSRLRECAPC